MTFQFFYKTEAIFDENLHQEGAFHAAQGGTLFLDELQSYPLDIQAMLLRVIDEGRFRRLGSSAWEQHNVRIIAATSRDPQDLVREGLLDRGLYRRLAFYIVRIPPLRDRVEDVPALAVCLLEQLAAQLKTTPPALSEASLRLLGSCEWSEGNIGELRTVLAACLTYAPRAPIIEEDVVRRILGARGTGGGSGGQSPAGIARRLAEIGRDLCSE